MSSANLFSFPLRCESGLSTDSDLVIGDHTHLSSQCAYRDYFTPCSLVKFCSLSLSLQHSFESLFKWMCLTKALFLLWESRIVQIFALWVCFIYVNWVWNCRSKDGLSRFCVQLAWCWFCIKLNLYEYFSFHSSSNLWLFLILLQFYL